MPNSSVRGHTYARTNWLFLRLLGLTYVVAFLSLHGQVIGLIGRDGITPAAGYLTELSAWADDSGAGVGRYLLTPTIFWFDASDTALRVVTAGGVVLGLLLTAGLLPAIALPLLWVAYLSITVAGGDFFLFQWDALLLETGLLACLVSPVAWRHRRGYEPSPIGRWLLWWLAIRLMFGSGVVKYGGGDPSWLDLTALAVHYETQPLPTPLAWFVAQLPLWAHRVSTAAVLGVELVVPWFVLAGTTPRRFAAAVLIAFQLLIALTGNFGFFNLLSIAICVALLDDQWLTPGGRPGPDDGRWGWRRTLVPAVVAVVLFPLSVHAFARQLRLPTAPVVERAYQAVRPFRSVNSYGLFAVMTTTRPEVIVEGSLDGVAWREYEFRHKPGPLDRRPTWVAPFHPRLDWQMWFAALSRYEEEPWLQSFCRRLQDGSSPVRQLLADDPFDGATPRFMRATLYRYRFAPPGSARWWTRERIADYAEVCGR